MGKTESKKADEKSETIGNDKPVTEKVAESSSARGNSMPMKDNLELVKKSRKQNEPESITASKRYGFVYGNSNLPEGWGLKEVNNGIGMGTKKILCDRKGKVFPSRSRAYEHMLRSKGYSQI